VDEYYYRSIATVWLIIVHVQCLRTDLEITILALPYD